MTNKILKITVFLLFFAGLLLSCKEKKEPKTDLEPTGLKGTKWKLEGIVDVKTGDIKVLEPLDCEECYTIFFETDYNATATLISGTMLIDLNHLYPSTDIPEGFLCEMYEKDGIEYCDTDDFKIAIYLTKSFYSTCDELRLNRHQVVNNRYVDEIKSYLLFNKKIQQ